jgi:hypothetical protein
LPATGAPEVLGLIGQTQLALNLTDETGTMLWQIAMGLSAASADFSSAKLHTQYRFDKTLSLLGAEAKSRRHHAWRLFAF